MSSARRFAVRCTAALAVFLIVAAPCGATTLPAWIDDGITGWNSDNPSAKISFVNIKDSFVWYDMPKSTPEDQKRIRERLDQVVLAHSYVPMDDEEKVTTARPPAASGPTTAKKCWSRSFVMNIAAQNETKAVGAESPGQQQRMLTRMVCDDAATWWVAFRIVD